MPVFAAKLEFRNFFQDSVKMDLLYAVREEVDAIRDKLSDLETKIYRLEVENSLLLREYVPKEILERMISEGFVRRKRSTCCPPPSQQQVDTQSPYSTSNSLCIQNSSS